MLFNSLIFPLFLFVVLTLHWFSSTLARRNRILLIASYIFYGWWDWRFLSLIVVSSLMDYACGLGLGRTDNLRHRRALLLTSLVANLGILALFKYFNFFMQNVTHVFTAMGLTPDWPTLNILLPVGISFYTFQTLSYTIDVYRGRCAVCEKLSDFMLFVAFFPQLVAGPIEKATHLLPELTRDRRFDPAMAVFGMRCILIGYLLKCVLADNMAAVVTAAYADPTLYAGPSLLFATYCFAFQIYGDFAGYSFIAIGVAALFGVRLNRNFDSPYISQSVKEFWGRWHISLSSWFSEYVYIALLGGNRVGRVRRVVNIMVTFVVSGLWHGANWTFVVWGMLNGGLYFLGKPFSSRAKLGAVMNVVVCFHLICLTWIFFRAESLVEAWLVLTRVLSFAPGTNLVMASANWLLLLPIATVIGWEALQRNRGTLAEMDYMPRLTRYAFYYAALLALFFCGSYDRVPFLYFQF